MNHIHLTFETPKKKVHAHYNAKTKDVTIYLSTLTKLLKIPEEFFPFNTTEKLINEIAIHELLHEITRIHDDSVIDSWHMLECRLVNNFTECKCPIDCYFRVLAGLV